MTSNTRRSGRFTLRAALRLLAISAIIGGSVFLYLKYLTPQKLAVRKHLSQADDKSEKAIDVRLKPLVDLFAKGRKGAPAFAKASLSWGGKWALVKGVAVKNSHKEYLSDLFAAYVFSPDDLRSAIEGVCLAYADDLVGIENQLLVGLRADLADPDRPYLPQHLRSSEAFTQEYRKLASRVAGQTGSDLAVGASREVLVLVATEIATRAAIQAARSAAAEMGVQGGILATGVGSTIATLGVGLIIAVIIDYVQDAIFRMAGYDPEAKVAAAVVESIDKMEAALLRNPNLVKRYLKIDTKGSLRIEMERLHDLRSQQRRDTVELMLKEGEGK